MKKKDFPTFNDIDHRPLRIYNRTVFFHNLWEDQGPTVAAEYAETFSKEEKFEIAQMTKLVKLKGVKHVQSLVTQGLEFSDDDFRPAGDVD